MGKKIMIKLNFKGLKINILTQIKDCLINIMINNNSRV